MRSQTERFQPFPTTDSQVQPLLDVARLAATFIAPGSGAPEVVWDRHSEDVPYQSDDTIWRVGDVQAGFRVHIHNGYMDPGAHVVNRVLVTAYGLPEGTSLEIECCRSGYDPRFLELRVTADDTALARVVASFRERFEAEATRPLTPGEVESEALSIRNCLRRADWERAEQRARYVLARHPDQPDALLGLGCALGATGRAAAALTTLERACRLAPDNQDAWYNLGNSLLALERNEEAIGAFERALALAPGTHAILYRLGEAREKAGISDGALDAYHAALRSAPDREWYTPGMDFTDQARKALRRLAARPQTRGRRKQA